MLANISRVLYNSAIRLYILNLKKIIHQQFDNKTVQVFHTKSTSTLIFMSVQLPNYMSEYTYNYFFGKLKNNKVSNSSFRFVLLTATLLSK